MRRRSIALRKRRVCGWALGVVLISLLLSAGCRDRTAVLLPPESVPPVVLAVSTPTPAPATPAASIPTPLPPPVPGDEPAPEGEPTPIYTGPLSPACGLLLPAVPAAVDPATTNLTIDPTARAELQRLVPEAAWPALARILDVPGTVGLAAYQLGQPEAGVYLNAGTPMPLASVVKLLVLIGYAEAVGAGELNPLQPVALADLERFYLPRFDLGAHQRAVAELRANGRVYGDSTPTIALEDIAWMMIRHSSNAASDYLHQRLGQARLEQIAVDMGLTTQTAPCPFIGQFLMMGNHTRTGSDAAVLRTYLEDPSGYGAAVSLLADAFSNSAEFRRDEAAWREATRRPSIETQRLFSDTLNAQGSAGDYAALMARLAQNGLSSPESSFIARRILEWPMQFPANQELFSNAGYKNGSLPGVLTTAYYVYRWNDAAPVVVTLFYRDLPQQTYRQWRQDLPHDELARWLLSDPAAIPLLRQAFMAAE